MPKKGKYCFNDPKVRCDIYLKTDCINYVGSNLPNIDVATNDSLTEILHSLNFLFGTLSAPSTTDEKVKISLNDTLAGFLGSKLLSGAGISLIENNNGSNETLSIINTAPDLIVTLTAGSNVTITGTYPDFTISASGGSIGTDELIKISSNDTTAGYLNDKLVAGTGITLTENNDGGNETLSVINNSPDQTVVLNNGAGISVTGAYPNFTITSTITQYTDEMAQDTVATLIQNGTGISWSYNDIANTLTPTVSLSPFSTTDLAEGINLYYTDERVDDRVAALLIQGTGITLVYNDIANTLTVTNSDLGSSQNIFKNIAVSGQNTVIADSNNDTLTFVEGTNITITTDDTTDSITINSTSGGSGTVNSGLAGKLAYYPSTGTTVDDFVAIDVATSGDLFKLTHQNTTDNGILLQGIGSQTGNFLTIKNSGGTSISYFNKDGQLRIPAFGGSGTPSLHFGNENENGLFGTSGIAIAYYNSTSGANTVVGNAAVSIKNSVGGAGFYFGSPSFFGTSIEMSLTSPGSGILQLLIDAANPLPVTIRGNRATAVNTNEAGENFTFEGIPGTGNSTSGGDFIFSTPDAGASGTVVQSVSPKFRIGRTGYLEINEIAAPSTPASGFGRLYEKSDGKIYFLNNAGTEYDLTATGGGGSGTVNTGAQFKAAYYSSAGTTVDDWIGVEFGNTNLNTKIIQQAIGDVALEIKGIAGQTGDFLNISSSSGSGGDLVKFTKDGYLRVPAGVSTSLSTSALNIGNVGLSEDGVVGGLRLFESGAYRLFISGQYGMAFRDPSTFAFDVGNSNFGTTNRFRISAPAVGTLQLGMETTQQAMIFKGSNNSGTDAAAFNLTIQSGAGTGNSTTNGDIYLSTSDAGVSGTTVQSYTPKLTVTKAGNTELFGTLKVGSISQDDTETKVVVWNSTDKILEWRDVTTIGSGFTNLTQFVSQTAWRSFYSDGSGDVQELAFGASSTYLQSTGTTSAPIWSVPKGAATYVVAANDSPAALKARADYVCDGTADESEINTALALGNVRLVEGTYNITTTGIQMPSNTTLSGEGDGTVLVGVSFATTNKMITNSGSTGIIIRDLKIDGAAQTVGFAIHFNLVGSGLEETAVTGCVIENVFFKEIYQSAIELESCRHSIISNNRFEETEWDDIVLKKKVAETDGCINIIIKDNIGNGSTAAVWARESTYCTIQNNIFESLLSNGNGAIGIQVESTCSYFNISNNTVKNYADNGISVSGGGDNLIVGNTVKGTNFEGIYVSASSRSQVVGNHVSFCGREGIYADSDHMTVGDNLVHTCSQATDNTYAGIAVFSTNITVTGNKVWRGSQTNKNQYGIKCNGAATNVMIEGNYLYQSGSTGDITGVPASGMVRNNVDNAGIWKDLLYTAYELQLNTAKLLGRYTAGQGKAEEITIGSGLNLDGSGNLTATGTGSGITRTVVVTSGSITLGNTASTDYMYFVAGAHTLSMPAASGNTNRYSIKNNHSANITIDTAGAENIEGAASISIAPEESVDVISDGTNWFII